MRPPNATTQPGEEGSESGLQQGLKPVRAIESAGTTTVHQHITVQHITINQMNTAGTGFQSNTYSLNDGNQYANLV